MHIGIIGASTFGKTYAMNAMIPHMIKQCAGRLPIFCSDFDIESETLHKFDKDTGPDFMRAVFTAENAERFVIVDEVPDTIGHGNSAKPFRRLPRKGRHPGHLCIFAFQDFNGAEPIFRSQCTSWMIFHLNLQDDADKLCKQLGHEIIKDAPLLERGNFIWVHEGKAEVLRLSA